MADGRIRVIESGSIDDDQLVTSLHSLRGEAQRLGGSLFIESAPAEIKSRIDAWGDLGARGQLMQRIKQQLDPDNILSPGRYVAVAGRTNSSYAA